MAKQMAHSNDILNAARGSAYWQEQFVAKGFPLSVFQVFTNPLVGVG
jgi:hypothetical protein